MAITTWSKVQSVLGLDDDKETLVDALIPLVEEDYLAIRNKPFDTYTKLTITNAATSDGEITVTISDAMRDMSYMIKVREDDSKLLVAQRIAIYFSLRNICADGDDVLFIGSGISLLFGSGDTGVTADVTAMGTYYPPGAEYTAIKMIDYHMNAGKGAGISSESLGDYSITYDTGLGSRVADYPRSIVGGIKRYVSYS